LDAFSQWQGSPHSSSACTRRGRLCLAKIGMACRRSALGTFWKSSITEGVREAFNPPPPAAIMASRPAGVRRADAAPEGGVYPKLLLGGVELDLEGLESGGDWVGVERHVGDGGNAAGGCGARGGFKALPLGAPGLVDMHMAVHQTRHDHVVPHILDG